jgi:hypothetical protein
MSCNGTYLLSRRRIRRSNISSSSPIRGRAAHEKGTAHRWSEQEAKEAGRKGGAASHRNGHRTASRGQALAGEPVTEESAIFNVPPFAQTPRRNSDIVVAKDTKRPCIASKGGKAAHEKGTAHRWHRTASRGRAPAAEPVTEEHAQHDGASDDHSAEEVTTEEPESNGVPS